MLEASPTTKVVSLEIDPYLKGWLSSCLADAKLPQIAERHEIVLGAALDSIPKLTGKFDMVFVDANKSEYKSYVENLLKFNLLAPGGVIVCDNILYNGYPYMRSQRVGSSVTTSECSTSGWPTTLSWSRLSCQSE